MLPKQAVPFRDASNSLCYDPNEYERKESEFSCTRTEASQVGTSYTKSSSRLKNLYEVVDTSNLKKSESKVAFSEIDEALLSVGIPVDLVLSAPVVRVTPKTADIIRVLEKRKEKAVNFFEDYQLAKQLTLKIKKILEIGDEITRLESLKANAVKSEDYDLAQKTKLEAQVLEAKMKSIFESNDVSDPENEKNEKTSWQDIPIAEFDPLRNRMLSWIRSEGPGDFDHNSLQNLLDVNEYSIFVRIFGQFMTMCILSDVVSLRIGSCIVARSALLELKSKDKNLNLLGYTNLLQYYLMDGSLEVLSESFILLEETINAYQSQENFDKYTTVLMAAFTKRFATLEEPKLLDRYSSIATMFVEHGYELVISLTADELLYYITLNEEAPGNVACLDALNLILLKFEQCKVNLLNSKLKESILVSCIKLLAFFLSQKTSKPYQKNADEVINTLQSIYSDNKQMYEDTVVAYVKETLRPRFLAKSTNNGKDTRLAVIEEKAAEYPPTGSEIGNAVNNETGNVENVKKAKEVVEISNVLHSIQSKDKNTENSEETSSEPVETQNRKSPRRKPISPRILESKNEKESPNSFDKNQINEVPNEVQTGETTVAPPESATVEAGTKGNLIDEDEKCHKKEDLPSNKSEENKEEEDHELEFLNLDSTSEHKKSQPKENPKADNGSGDNGNEEVVETLNDTRKNKEEVGEESKHEQESEIMKPPKKKKSSICAIQ